MGPGARAYCRSAININSYQPLSRISWSDLSTNACSHLDNQSRNSYESALNFHLGFVHLHDLDSEPSSNILSLFTTYMSKRIKPLVNNSCPPCTAAALDSSSLALLLSGPDDFRGRNPPQKDDLRSQITLSGSSALHVCQLPFGFSTLSSFFRN